MVADDTQGRGDAASAQVAIRRLASMAVPGPGRSSQQQQRELVRIVAGDLRRAIVADSHAASNMPAMRALAMVVTELPSGADRDLADLRLFARATLAECADLLALEPRSLRRRWQVLRTTLFRRARQRR